MADGDSEWIVGLPAAGRLVGKNARTISVWIAQGRLPHAHQQQGRWRIDPVELVAVAGMPYLMDIEQVKRDMKWLQHRVNELERRDREHHEMLRDLMVERLRRQRPRDYAHPDLTTRAAVAAEMAVHGLSVHTVLNWLERDAQNGAVPLGDLAALVALMQTHLDAAHRRGRASARYLLQCTVRPTCWCREWTPPLPKE